MKYGFIGCGNMGGALAGAAAKAVPADEILVSDRDGAKTAAFSAETGASVGSAAQVAEKCGYIFLGVKPQMLADMFSEIRPVLEKRSGRFVLVSMAAGSQDIKDKRACRSRLSGHKDNAEHPGGSRRGNDTLLHRRGDRG